MNFSVPVLNFPEYIPKTFGAYGGSLIIPIPKEDFSQTKIEFINNTSGVTAKCGQYVCGLKNYIGESQFDANSGMLSFSRRIRNEYTGEMELIKGANVKTLDVDLQIMNTEYNRIYALLSMLDGIPCVFQANNDSSTKYEPLIVYGYIDSFNLILRGALYSDCNLTIKGMI